MRWDILLIDNKALKILIDRCIPVFRIIIKLQVFAIQLLKLKKVLFWTQKFKIHKFKLMSLLMDNKNMNIKKL
jgi:hypothetical protein